MKSRTLRYSSSSSIKHAIDVGGDEVARRFVDEVHVFVQQRRRRRALVRFQDAVPHADQHAEVGDQLGFADAARPPCARRSPCPRAGSLHHRL